MNIINQSMDISLSLLPKAKVIRQTKNKFFHFAFGFKKNKLLAIGQNNPEKTHTQALVLSRKFFNSEMEHPYLHAETDLISRLWGRHYVDGSLRVVVVRLNKRGELRCSKPCEKCSQILDALGVKKIWWSEENGFIQQS